MPHDTSSSSLFGRLSARSSFISPKDVKVTIQLLNDADTISNEFKRSLPAQAIVDYICEVKNIKEKDFFGLRYQDHSKHRYWVDLSRPISHIAKNFKTDSLNLRLRFRYYPSNPAHLRDTCTKYQLFVQLQRDLLHGRLYCPHQKAVELGGYILQAQLGDYDENIHVGNYVSQYTLLLKQTPRNEEKIAEYHQSFKGMNVEEAERKFIEKASTIETYGFDPYTVKDPRDGLDVFIGVNHLGILIFHNNQKVHNIPWNVVSKVDYIGKEIRIMPTDKYTPPVVAGEANETIERDKKSRLVLKYNCPSGTFAKHLWNHILSQQVFFNEATAQHIKPKFSKPRIPLLSRGSTFRFTSPRVLKEIENISEAETTVADLNESTISQFDRYPLPAHEPRVEQPWMNKSATLPNPKVNNHNNNHNQPEFLTTESTASPNNSSLNITSPNHLIAFNETPQTNEALISPFSPSENLSKSIDGSNINTTSFTIHLVKYEKSPSCSPEPSTERNSPETVTTEPLLTSTPLFKRKESNVNGNGIVGNGTNGHVVCDKDESAHLTAPSKRSSVINYAFGTFLLILLLISLFIAVFERNERSDWVEGVPLLSHIRHSYYEPARQFTVQQYSRLISRK